MKKIIAIITTLVLGLGFSATTFAVEDEMGEPLLIQNYETVEYGDDILIEEFEEDIVENESEEEAEEEEEEEGESFWNQNTIVIFLVIIAVVIIILNLMQLK